MKVELSKKQLQLIDELVMFSWAMAVDAERKQALSEIISDISIHLAGVERVVHNASVVVEGKKYYAKELEGMSQKTVLVIPKQARKTMNIFYKKDFVCVAHFQSVKY